MNIRKMFGGHVHSPSKSLLHSTSPSQHGESKSLISPSGESLSRFYLEMKRKMFGGHVHSPSMSLLHSTSPSQGGESRSHSAQAESHRQDSIYEMKRKMFGGHVHSPSKGLLHSTSPSQRGESTSLISPSGVSPPRLDLSIRNEKEKCLGGMSTHLVRVLSTSPGQR